MKAIFNNLMKLSMYLDKNLLIIECELIFMAAQKKSFGQRVIAHWYQIWAELLQSCTATQERVKGHAGGTYKNSRMGQPIFSHYFLDPI